MTDTFPGAEVVVQPKAQTSSFDPSVEAAARQMLGAYFGPGGMMSQPQPIPMRQVAGLGSMDVMARNLSGGLGGFAPQLNQASQYMQQSAMGYNPYAAQSFMNPYMQNVYQPQMQEIGRVGEQQKRDARSRQAQTGAFGGSRGAIQEAEIDRNTMQQQAKASGDMLYRGYGDAMDRSMSSFENMQNRMAGAGQGIAALGQQGYNMLTGQIETLGNLGREGRGIQDRAFDAQYQAATQMADEPYMRCQRGQQMLQGFGQFLPTYASGYGSDLSPITTMESQSGLDRFREDAQNVKDIYDMFFGKKETT